MRTRRGPLLALSLLTAAAGCLTADQISILQKDVSDLRAEVEAVRAAQRQQQESLRDIEQKVSGTSRAEQEQRADIELRLRTLEDQVRVLGERGDQAARRLEAISSEIASLRSSLAARPQVPPLPRVAPGPAPGEEPAPPAAPAPAPAGVPESAQSLFNAAYADYSKGNYALAIRGFEDFLSRFGDTELADNARYWIGVCHYDAGDYEAAIREFDRLLAEMPDGDKAAGADLKKGLAYLEMNRKAQGIVQLQHVIKTHPETDEARIARERLRSMGLRVD